MIIGFCGLAGSGKDTVADFLVSDGFTKVALADPLKRICRDAFQFTEEQLWGPSSERNKPDQRYPRGEATVTAHIQVCLKCRGEHVSPVPGSLELEKGSSLHNLPCPEGGTHDVRQSNQLGQLYLTPRLALQLLGTEWGRVCYPNVWVEYMLRVAKELLETQLEDDRWQPRPKGFHRTYYSGPRGIYGGLSHRQVKGVTVSDVRFINEVEAINAGGGHVFQLLRGQGLSGSAGLHKSETEMQSIPKHLFKGIIDNRDWSLGQLQLHARTIQQDILKGN